MRRSRLKILPCGHILFGLHEYRMLGAYSITMQAKITKFIVVVNMFMSILNFKMRTFRKANSTFFAKRIIHGPVAAALAAAKTAVQLKIYDLNGRVVRTLVDQHQQSGYHLIRWDGADNSGGQLVLGMYLAQLNAGGISKTIKLTILN